MAVTEYLSGVFLLFNSMAVLSIHLLDGAVIPGMTGILSIIPSVMMRQPTNSVQSTMDYQVQLPAGAGKPGEWELRITLFCTCSKRK